MSIEKIRSCCLAIMAPYIFISASNVLADKSILSEVLFGDIDNIAIGEFNLSQNRYLFSIPKDRPPTDRGLIWGVMDIYVYQGKKHPSVSIFECGLLTSHLGPYTIDFSDDDEYLVVESGGEGGSMIDVFRVGDILGPESRGWNGTDKCVKPLASLGGHNLPATFYGWSGHMPLIKSPVPLNRVSTPKQVFELEGQGMCCDGDPQIFAWDIFTNQFTVSTAPQ